MATFARPAGHDPYAPVRHGAAGGGRVAPPGADLSDGPPSDRSRCNSYYDQWRGDCADRRPCPNPGESRHGGKCIQTASEHAGDKRRREKKQAAEPTPAEVMTRYEAPEPTPVPVQGDAVPTPYTSEAPNISNVMETIPKAAPTPPPPQFQRRSFADIMADPRVVQGTAAANRQLGSVAEAAGVRGAPVLAARTTAGRNIASDAYGRGLAEDLQSYGAQLAGNRELYGRSVDDWNRAFAGATAQIGATHGRRGLDIQQTGMAGSLAQQAFMRQFLPHQLQSQQEHALAMQGLGFDFQRGILPLQFGHQQAMQGARLDHATAQQQAELAQRRWAEKLRADLAIQLGQAPVHIGVGGQPSY